MVKKSQRFKMSQLNRFMYQSEHRLLLSAVHNPHKHLISDTCGSHVCSIQARAKNKKTNLWETEHETVTWTELVKDVVKWWTWVWTFKFPNVENISTGWEICACKHFQTFSHISVVMSVIWTYLNVLQPFGLLNFSSSQISISVLELQHNHYYYEHVSNTA